MALGVAQTGSAAPTGVPATVLMNTTPGNLIVVFASEGASGTATATITDSTSGSNSWTQAGGYATAAGSRIGCFFTKNAAAVTSITANYGGPNVQLVVYEISGADQVNPKDGDASNPATSTSTVGATSLTSGKLNTQNANAIILFGAKIGGSDVLSSSGAGFSIPSGGQVSGTAVSFSIVTGVLVSGTAAMTWGISRSNDVSLIAAFIATTGAGFTFPPLLIPNTNFNVLLRM